MLVRFVPNDEDYNTFTVWLQDYSLSWDKRYLGTLEKFW